MSKDDEYSQIILPQGTVTWENDEKELKTEDLIRVLVRQRCWLANTSTTFNIILLSESKDKSYQFSINASTTDVVTTLFASSIPCLEKRKIGLLDYWV